MLMDVGWQVRDLTGFDPYKDPNATYRGIAVREYPTHSDPADYALFARGKLLGILEAKKQGVGTQNVPEQAKRYACGIAPSVGQWGEYFVNVRLRCSTARPTPRMK